MTRKRAAVYTVNYGPGVNLRAGPSKQSDVIRVLQFGAAVEPEPDKDSPEGWIPVKGGGYVMREFLK